MQQLTRHFGTDKLQGKTFAIWGLAFKPKTDDTREAPALTVIEELLRRGASVVAFDPEATQSFEVRIGKRPNLSYANTNYDALKGADALLICTEWGEFRQPNFDKMKQLLKSPLVFDGRNILDMKEAKRHGFTYYSIGRPVVR